MKPKKQTAQCPKITYEKEDDILNIWFSPKPFDYGHQIGDIIFHSTAEHELVYMEVLNATEFLREEAKALPKELKQSLFA